jgi:hypothetical protein
MTVVRLVTIVTMIIVVAKISILNIIVPPIVTMVTAFP